MYIICACRRVMATKGRSKTRCGLHSACRTSRADKLYNHKRARRTGSEGQGVLMIFIPRLDGYLVVSFTVFFRLLIENAFMRRK